jgi:hypothetical protein
MSDQHASDMQSWDEPHLHHTLAAEASRLRHHDQFYESTLVSRATNDLQVLLTTAVSNIAYRSKFTNDI